MALELLAGRWLAPVFGATLTTWTWVIAVTLGAGALGAWLGAVGKERGTAAPLLWGALFVAGDALRAPNLLADLVTLPTVAGAGLGACVVLLLPVTALSMVLPRLIARHAAIRPGRLIASGTLGALAGTLGAGLVAIPHLGLRATAFVVAGLLLLGALLTSRGRAQAGGAATLLLGAAAGALFLGAPTAPGEIAARESLAGRVSLTREPRGLTLRVDGVLQGMGGVEARDGAALVLRGQHVGLLPYLRPTAKTALMVGLGSGLFARVLAAHAVAVETLEVNADLVGIAREHLGVRGSVLLDDGRAGWRRLQGRYDLIVLDAFQGEGLPGHLLTREAFGELARRLSPGGVLAVHLIGAPGHRVTAAVARTLASVFPERLALRSRPDETLQDLVLLASAAPLNVPPHPELLEAGFDGRAVFAPPADGLLLTDDLCPLETWNEPLARALRERNRSEARDG